MSRSAVKGAQVLANECMQGKNFLNIQDKVSPQRKRQICLIVIRIVLPIGITSPTVTFLPLSLVLSADWRGVPQVPSTISLVWIPLSLLRLHISDNMKNLPLRGADLPPPGSTRNRRGCEGCYSPARRDGRNINANQ
jgi:hypothetical protein